MLTEIQRKQRKLGIGGSDAAAIMGLSKWKTPLDVYLDKTTDSIEETTNSMHFGNKLEPIIAEEYQRVTGKKLKTDNDMIIHPEYEFLIANVDGLIIGEKTGFEAKTASAFNAKEWGESGSDDIPTQYIIQCAHYAMVADLEKIDVAVLLGGQDFRIYTINRNEKLEQAIMKKEKDFWNDNVLPKIPPKPSTINDINKIYNSVTSGQSVIAEEKTIQMLDYLNKIKQKKKELEEQEENCKIDIFSAMKDAEFLYNNEGELLATWKIQHRKAFQVKESSSRVFRIK